MKVHAIFNDTDNKIIEVGSYSLADYYTSQMIEDYLYVICDESVKVFQWFIEGKDVHGSCVIKKLV